jgi:hypothetical protein
MNLYCLAVALAFTLLQCCAQNITGTVGAKSWMLGGTAVAHKDLWSVNNNPAAFTSLQNTQFGLYSEERFNENNLRLANLSVVVPSKHVHVGAALTYFGYSVFNQQKLGVSLSKALGQSFSLGVQLNYVSTFIEQQGHAGNIATAVGILATPIPKLRIGFMLFNPTQNSYGTYTTEKIPSYGKMGCVYDVSEKVALHAEAHQILNQQLSWRGGVYYAIHDAVHLAVGAATQPAYYTFGTTLLMKSMKLDMAASFHEVLGFTPHVGCSIPVSR